MAKYKYTCEGCGTQLVSPNLVHPKDWQLIIRNETHMAVRCPECQTVISKEHVESLIQLVKWLKVVIEKRNQGTVAWTQEYCDELIAALKGDRHEDI